jgi:hypothetical protein
MYADDYYDEFPADLGVEGEVGRLLSKRARRRLGFALGGPLGFAIAKRRQRNQATKARARELGRQLALAQAAPGMMSPALARPPVPVTAGNSLIAGSQRQRVLGLGSATIAAGAQGNLSAVAQMPMQAERLFLSSPDLAGFVVNSVLFGSQCTEIGVEPYPAEAFRYDAEDIGLLYRPVGPGITVTVVLTNNNAADATISGMFKAASTD